jgi:flagellar basal body rod protein FlgG
MSEQTLDAPSSEHFKVDKEGYLMTKSGYYLGDRSDSDDDIKLTKKQRKAIKAAKRTNDGRPSTRGAAVISSDESEESSEEEVVKSKYNIGNTPNQTQVQAALSHQMNQLSNFKGHEKL